MSASSNKKFGLYPEALPFLIGLFAFFLVVGPRVLIPWNIAWLGRGDPATHYLGWLFFRNSGWSFPVGLNTSYGLEIGNAIVFSDSLPLLAFLFKPLSALLPATFQYFGFWLLLCFILQAYFAWKLIGLVSEQIVIRTLASAFFVFAPPMLWRLRGHLSLTGHFLVLAALYLTLRCDLQRRKLAWGFLLTVTALVHPYILAMVGLLWLTDLFTKMFDRTLAGQQAALEFLILFIATGFTCWQAGYFSVGDAVSGGGFGFYRMNLLAPFDPNGWSYILKDIPGVKGDYEGFNYLGLGAIILLLPALGSLIFRKPDFLQAARRRPLLLLLMAGLTLFALSNKIGIGPHEVVYRLPEGALRLANVFRASGRFFWPVFYMILYGIIYLIVRGYERRTAMVLLLPALFVQIADTGAGYRDIRKRLMKEPAAAWTHTLSSPFWAAAAERYSKVRYILPRNKPGRWKTIAAYAGNHGLSTDAVYLARIDRSALRLARERAARAIIYGRYEADSLYIIIDDAFLRTAAGHVDQKNDLLARIDGLYVLAPGWKKCNSCIPVEGEVKAKDLFLPIRKGEKILFSKRGMGKAFLGPGWSWPENWGTWSDGTEATLFLPLPGRDVRTILIEAMPFLSRNHSKQSVQVRINGHAAGRFTMRAGSSWLLKLDIPEDLIREGGSTSIIRLDFYLPDAARAGEDPRKLALGLKSLTVQ